jgi:hypothetical protein
MDGRPIYMKLAEAWREAAREVTNTALKAFYADRAAQYLALALGEEADTSRDRGGNCE